MPLFIRKYCSHIIIMLISIILVLLLMLVMDARIDATDRQMQEIIQQ
jgi:hypothetical protein